MIFLCSGTAVNFVNRQNDRGYSFCVPAKPKKATQKTKPKGDNTANYPATNNDADTFCKKRRWVQNEYDSSRLSGKATRELYKIYNKKNSGKLQDQRTMARRLTDKAKDAKDLVVKNCSNSNHLYAVPATNPSICYTDYCGKLGLRLKLLLINDALATAKMGTKVAEN